MNLLSTRCTLTTCGVRLWSRISCSLPWPPAAGGLRPPDPRAVCLSYIQHPLGSIGDGIQPTPGGCRQLTESYGYKEQMLTTVASGGWGAPPPRPPMWPVPVQNQVCKGNLRCFQHHRALPNAFSSTGSFALAPRRSALLSDLAAAPAEEPPCPSQLSGVGWGEVGWGCGKGKPFHLGKWLKFYPRLPPVFGAQPGTLSFTLILLSIFFCELVSFSFVAVSCFVPNHGEESIRGRAREGTGGREKGSHGSDAINFPRPPAPPQAERGWKPGDWSEPLRHARMFDIRTCGVGFWGGEGTGRGRGVWGGVARSAFYQYFPPLCFVERTDP